MGTERSQEKPINKIRKRLEDTLIDIETIENKKDSLENLQGQIEEIKQEIEKKELKDEDIVIDKALEEKIEKARTIDELLKDSSDEVININDAIDDEIDRSFPEVEPLENEEELEPLKEEKHEASLEDDTLENDLFDLIDSMYENREEEK